jgi:hypothetical protein
METPCEVTHGSYMSSYTSSYMSTYMSVATGYNALTWSCEIPYNQVHVFVVINRFQKWPNSNAIILKAASDSEFTVKTKDAPFFMNFPSIYKLGQLFSSWTGPLKQNVTPFTKQKKYKQLKIA